MTLAVTGTVRLGLIAAVLFFSVAVRAEVKVSTEVQYETPDGSRSTSVTMPVTYVNGDELSRAPALNAQPSRMYALIWFQQNQVAIVLLDGPSAYGSSLSVRDFVRMAQTNSPFKGTQVNTNEARTWYLQPQLSAPVPSCKTPLDYAVSVCARGSTTGPLQGSVCGGAVNSLQQCLQSQGPSSGNCQVADYAARFFCGGGSFMSGALAGFACGQLTGLRQYACTSQ